MPTTMKDIANVLNVSVVTVSKALNNKPDISEKTKELVLKTAKELNYTPDGVARSLVEKKTNTLGVLVSDIKNLFFSETLNGIEAAARKFNYSILLCHSGYDPKIEYESILIFLSKRMDGLIIFPTQKDYGYIEMLKTSKIPFVFLHRRIDFTECNYVINDNVYGAYLAVDYLIKKGYKEIYFFAKHTQTTTYKERVEGCKKAMKENNLPLSDFKVINCEHNVVSFYDEVKRNINYNGERIGIFVWNDHMALGVYKALIDKGLKIPEESGLIGYDDVEFSKYLPITLTTIQNPGFEIGSKGVEIIINKIKSKAPSPADKIVLEPKLIIRESA